MRSGDFNIDILGRVNWQLLSHACGAISVPIATAYDTLGESGLAHSLNEPECVGVFTNLELLPTLARVLVDTPTVRVVIYDGDASPKLVDELKSKREGIKVLHIDELRQLGKGKAFDETRKPSPADTACIMYTSGSTGPPKGVVITHANLIASGMTLMSGYDA